MKSSIKGFFALALAILLTLSLASCFESSDEKTAATTAKATANTTAASTAAPIDYTNRIILCEDGKSNYVIVTPLAENDPAATDAATKVVSAVNREFDIFLRTTNHLTDEADYEIVVGNTNRYSPGTPLQTNQYLIRVEDEMVIIMGGSNKALLLAAQDFADNYVIKDANGKLSLPYDLSVKKTVDPALVYEEPEVVVTVATFNIANGRDCSYDFSVIAKDIVDSGAAVVGLQEVDQNTTRNKKQDTMKILSQKTGMKYYAYAKALDYGGGQYGNGILSKYPILRYEAIQLPESTTPVSHEEHRVVLHAVIDVEGTEVDFFVTHLEQNPAYKQMAKINEYTSKSDCFILLGDFNQEPASLVFGAIDNSYMVNKERDAISSTTKDGYDFDNIVHHEDMVTRNPRVIKTGHSDHYMLLADWVM
ncbi:MAG: endonuclease/exonuclease/phosphatase family protein [Clostridia bacterium]|nr:endonuclease/exonuclease/phosphatase family protein [Clostridia bacterium]